MEIPDPSFRPGRRIEAADRRENFVLRIHSRNDLVPRANLLTVFWIEENPILTVGKIRLNQHQILVGTLHLEGHDVIGLIVRPIAIVAPEIIVDHRPFLDQLSDTYFGLYFHGSF